MMILHVHKHLTDQLDLSRIERSFSSLCRLKTYLRNTMTSDHMMILYVHKHLTDELDLSRIAAEFCFL